MATKTENEKKGTTAVAPTNGNAGLPAGVAVTRTDLQIPMREIITSDGFLGPESLAHFLSEGYETQKHVRLTEGTYIKGIYAGMEDGELAARASGEVPQVKWVYVKVSENETVRLLGAYNMISQLKRCPEGAPVVIARGANYELPNRLQCTEYFVYWKAPQLKTPVSAETEAREVQGTRVS